MTVFFDSAQTKPRFIILRYRDYFKNSKLPSTEILHLDNTIIASGLAEHETITYEDSFSWTSAGDLNLIRKCEISPPDALILSSWSEGVNQPSLKALKIIRNMGIPIVAIWWDTCSRNFWSAPYMYNFDINVVMDNPCLHFLDQSSLLASRVIALWPPIDDTIYYPRKKDILVSFVGQISSYRHYRKEALDYLRKRNINAFFSTEDRIKQMSHLEYAAVLGRSSMSMNFSYSVDCHQLKSRALEVMFSEALLLESENSQLATLFEPMRDYVPFTSNEDLAEKIAYYSSHDDQRLEIARNGRISALEKCSSYRFWKMIINRIRSEKI